MARPGYFKEYYAKHREKRLTESCSYQREHRAERNIYMHKWHDKNKDRMRDYRKQIADKRNAHRRELYATSPKLREQKRAEAKAWQKANPEKRLDQRMRKYGITGEIYQRILSRQGNRCAICRSENAGDRRGMRFHVDHNHKTGKVRGLLCNNCNLGLGKFKDNPKLFHRAFKYLTNRRSF